jgi:CelD/BcsL family acetyltransferase involved in cellulose biosynthesis
LKPTDISLPVSTNITQQVPLETLAALWQNAGTQLDWSCMFTLPPWLTSWWSSLNTNHEALCILVADPDGIIGLAPLMRQGNQAAVIGSSDVCDYLDIVTVPQRQPALAQPFFDYIRQCGVHQLMFTGVRTESVIWRHLVPYAKAHDWRVDHETEEKAFGIDLPSTWEAFLYQLNGKQRHELRRKLRRLYEAGTIKFEMIDTPSEVAARLDQFIELFRTSRSDKAEFMTSRMSGFFRSMSAAMSQHRFISMGVMKIDGEVVSSVLCFDYQATRYLYNSGFDPRFRALSVGLLCKILSIQDAIDKGFARYDLLKGAEDYKQRLGAKPIKLYQCAVWLP